MNRVPKLVCRVMRRLGGAERVPVPHFEKQGKISCFYDVAYPSKYSNNVMDIYTVENAKGTLFYVHGGGFIFHDKSNRSDYLMQFVRAGYNVLNVNYVLYPNEKYGPSLEQMNEALCFVLSNAELYGIDRDKIVFGGDSAGGQLSGAFMNVLTNTDYAKTVNITPADSSFQPKGWISIGSLSHAPNFSETGFFVTDFLFGCMGRCCFETRDLKKSEKAREASVIDFVTEHFPPSFVSDGNFGTFTKDSIALVQRLEQLGVFVQSEFFDRSEKRLFHVFEVKGGKYADIVHKSHLKFLEQVL